MNLAVTCRISYAKTDSVDFLFCSQSLSVQKDLWPWAPEMKIYHALEMVKGEVRHYFGKHFDEISCYCKI